ncbi:SWI/SNF chromatin-remodeling complex subunit, partial [Serendipita sp. 401]
MANSQPQYPYPGRPPSAPGHAMMNMNMGGMMGSAPPQGLSIGNPTMGGMSGMPNPAMSGMGSMPNQHMNQYPLQMRANGMGQPMHGQPPMQQPGQGMYSSGVPLTLPHNPNQMAIQNPGMMMGRPPQQPGYPPSYPTQQPGLQHNPYGQPQPTQYGSMGMPYGSRVGIHPSQPTGGMPPQHGGGMPGNMAGYQQNGMMSTGPGRPPSAMGMHQPTPMMPGMAPTGVNMGMIAPSGTPVQGMKPPQTPTSGSMNPPPHLTPQQTPMMSNGVPLTQPPSHMGPGQQHAGTPGMNPTPQQLMQYQAMQYRQMQAQHAHQQMSGQGQGQAMNPSISIPSHPGQQLPQTPQTPQQPSAVTQASPVSSTAGVGPHPPTPQSANQPPLIRRTPTPSSATNASAPNPHHPPNSNPPMSAPTPINAGGTPTSATSYNRPPSAAGSASGGGSAGGMMPPPVPGGVPGKPQYQNGMPGMHMSTGSNMGMGMGMDPNALTQLQMLGQQVGMSGVSSVGPGMFSNPIAPPPAGPPGSMGPGMNGVMQQGGNPGMSRLQANPGLSRSMPSLRQAAIPPHPGMPRPGMPGAGMPLTTAGGHPGGHVAVNASGPGMQQVHPQSVPVGHPGMMARSTRPGETPTPTQPHFPGAPSSAPSAAPGSHHSLPPTAMVSAPGPGGGGPPGGPVVAAPPVQPAAPQNIAERTMSPRQRAAIIHTITRVSAVPVDDKDHPLSETLPDLEEAEIEKVHAWIEKDRKYESEYRKMKEVMGKELVEAFAIVPPGVVPGSSTAVSASRPLRWFEKDWREDAIRKDGRKPHYTLLWPNKRREEKMVKFHKMGRRPVFLPKKVDAEAASKPELLVPIRIDVDIGDGYNRLRDTFVWNANDPYVTPAVFAQSLCDDFAIGFGLGQPSEPAKKKFIDQVISSIQEQIADYKNHRVEIENVLPRAAIAPPSPRPTTPLPANGKPVSTVGGGLTVNGLSRDLSRSRSTTPLPMEREKSEKPPLSAIQKHSSGLLNIEGMMIGRKRTRPANDGPTGVGKFEDEEEEEWWTRWRKRMRVLDGSGVSRKSRKAALVAEAKKPVASGTSTPRKSRPRTRVTGPSSFLPNGSPTKGIKVEVEEVDLKHPLLLSEPDEYKRELIYVDENEGDVDGKTNEDLRILIKLDISYGVRRLEDQFEWDISDKRNSPELFAECYCMDLGLSGEFQTAIAHSIREQVQVYEKSLFLVGHPMDGSTIQDEDLRLAFLPSLNSCVRPADQVAAHTPQLNYFNEIELEKTFDRGGNRKRRQPRGRRAGAIPLPDRDPVKTFRTPMIGFPEVEKEKETWVPSRRQAAVVAERANAQIAVIESEPDLKPAPPFMGMIQPNSQSQANRQSSASTSNAAQKVPEIPKRDRQELLRGPPVAKRVLRSRPVPTSTALNPDAPVPEYLRGFDDKNKGSEKKKNLYKDRELPEGLHPNLIDGVWHCSSCGCPEEIAIGRRQGPLGPKTMCGDCGKWWHRHRKPMDIIYRTDKEYHIERKKKEEEYRRLKKKGGMKAAQAAAAALVDGRAAAAAAAQKQQTNTTYAAPLFTTVPRPLNNSTKAQPSPLKPVVVHSPDSSLSPPPFTPQTSKPNFDTVSLDPPKPVVPQTTALSRPPPSIPRATPTPSVMVNGSDADVVKPEWLINDMARLRAKYPDSAFYVLRKQPEEGANPEWRVKCNDCPQKLYKPGPNESLENFEVHLKNRQHLLRIAQRKGLAPSTPNASNASPSQ